MLAFYALLGLLIPLPLAVLGNALPGALVSVRPTHLAKRRMGQLSLLA